MTDVAVTGSGVPLDAAQVAARYGLKVAGERPSLAEYTRKLWAYRHFISAFSEAKHVVAYSEARLGSLWSVLTPLVNAAVYFLVFGLLLNARHGIHNYIAYLCAGVFVFGFTSKAVSAGIASISDNIQLVRAEHFPRGCLPLASVLADARQMVATTSVLMVIVVATGEAPRLSWFLVVPAVLLQVVFNTGLVFIVARLGARIADLKQLAPWVLRVWMYTSGVFYSPAVFAAALGGTAGKALQANPLLVYIELIRGATIGESHASLSTDQLWLLAVGWAAVSLAAGYIFFWRGEQEYGRG
jgi:teichoic acid transport system permease protein